MKSEPKVLSHGRSQPRAASSGARTVVSTNRLVLEAPALLVRGGELASMPHVPMLALNNARQGFLERHELDAILEHVPAYLHAPLIFAFTTGWRIHAEVMPLRVEQLDMAVGVERLEPGVTKNKEGRSFYLTKELRTVLEGQEESIAGLRKQGVICPYVFHRPNGSQIKNFRTTGRRRE